MKWKKIGPVERAVDQAKGIDLIVRSAAIDGVGNVTANIELWNGELLEQDKVALSTRRSRDQFAIRAAQVAMVDQRLVNQALLALAGGLPATIAAQIDDGADDADDADDDSKDSSRAEILVSLANDATLFHTPDQEAFVTFLVDEHRETWPVRSKQFRRYMARRYYQETHSIADSSSMSDALTTIEGQALFDGEERQVWTRLAEHGGNIYVDACNDEWEAVEVTPCGWRVVTDPPVSFRRARGMAPLPLPVPGGSIDDLRPFVNVAGDADFVLFISWILAALRPRGPYPVLGLSGEQGAAKSTTARVMRALVDPSTVPLRAEPRDGRDLMIAATNGWVVSLDNLSRLPVWLSDALCRLSTGGGFATRELYSNDEEALFEAQRPVILNGIEAVATRSDLIDRMEHNHLPRIAEDDRKTEAQFWSEFEAKRPAILGALLDAVASALANVEHIRLDRLPRLADFAVWITAAEPALGWEHGTFMSAFDTNRAEANDLVLDSDPVAPAIRQLAADVGTDGWRGTATDLLAALATLTAKTELAMAKLSEDEREAVIRKRADDIKARRDGWPRNGRAMRGTIERLAPNLRAAGVQVIFDLREGHERKRVIKVCNFASAPSAPSADPDGSTGNGVNPPDSAQSAGAAGPVHADANPENADAKPSMRTQNLDRPSAEEMAPGLAKEDNADGADDADAKFASPERERIEL